MDTLWEESKGRIAFLPGGSLGPKAGEGNHGSDLPTEVKVWGLRVGRAGMEAVCPPRCRFRV